MRRPTTAEVRLTGNRAVERTNGHGRAVHMLDAFLLDTFDSPARAPERQLVTGEVLDVEVKLSALAPSFATARYR